MRGRTFTEAESADAGREASTRPVIVSESTARNLWGDQDPIGRPLLRAEVALQVMGVSADAQLSTLGSVDRLYIYEPRRPGGVLLVKARGDFSALASSVRAIVRERDPSVAFRVLPLEANVAWWRGVSGTVTSLGAGLGMLALVLASVGIYGVVSFAVGRRSREIGIRMALGATAGSVLGTLLRQTLRPVVIGALVGVAAAAAISRILSSVLFGISPADSVGLSGAALLVLAAALAAGVLAARPATRADPVATLRYD